MAQQGVLTNSRVFVFDPKLFLVAQHLNFLSIATDFRSFFSIVSFVCVEGGVLTAFHIGSFVPIFCS